ncbi:MAG: tetratricopeptide repeat protein [Flavisolibacter sp.]|nr:tetratricopeptide repeat protein [Flavisolibacter sp.]
MLIWAEKYSGVLDDIFDVQEKISRSIVEALNIRLSVEENIQLASRPIDNANAYECYVRARQEMWRRTKQSMDNAIEFTEQGLDVVGENALLYATLGTVYLFSFHYGIRPDPLYREKAIQYATKSLDLDPTCAQALFVMGLIEYENGKLQEASRIFKKVLHLDPNNTDAIHFLIIAYSYSGRAEAARPFTDRLLLIDPLTPFTRIFPGLIDFFEGKIEESLPSNQLWLQLEPNNTFDRFWYANVLAVNNRIEECFQILDTIIRDMPKLIFAQYAMFLKSALQGNREAALHAATDELKTVAATLDYLPLFMAWTYSLVGEADEALAWLHKSLKFGQSPYSLLLKWKTFQTVLKDHLGFQEYMQEIKKRSEQFVV